MRPADFFIDDQAAGVDGLIFGLPTRHLDDDLVNQLRRGPLPDREDIEVAVPLARLVHDELQKYGTGGGIEMNDDQMRGALLTLRAVVERLGFTNFEVPFRDFNGFRTWWLANDAYGSWQARRD